MVKRASRKQKRFEKNDDNYALDNKFNLDIKPFTPLTKNQELVFKNFSQRHQFLHGMAGTGKTFIAIYLALNEVFSRLTPFKRIVIVRSLVQTREMGHLPGKAMDKMREYEAPYIPICGELFGRGDAYSILKQKGIIEFISTSFVRGITLNDAIIIVDECQNQTAHELHSIITRVGSNCKIVFCGDLKQSDLNQRKEYSGLSDFMKIIKQMNCFDFVEFVEDDIVRSQLVKHYLITRNRLEENGTIKTTIV